MPDEDPFAEESPSVPWLTIWLSPRQTIRQIVETDPGYGVLVLSAAAGSGKILMNTGKLANSGFAVSLPAALIGGAIFGVLMNRLMGWLYAAVGRRLGGKASSEEMRAALAWSGLPNLVSFAILFLAMPHIAKNSGISQYTLLLGSLVFSLFWGLWSLVLLCQTVSEVHQFPVYKSILTLIAGALLVSAVLFSLIAAAVSIPAFLGGRAPALPFRPQTAVTAPARIEQKTIAFSETAPGKSAAAGSMVDWKKAAELSGEVRVALADGKTVEGRLVAVTETEVYLDSGGKTLNLPKEQITDIRPRQT